MSKKFLITVKETHYTTYEVESDSLEGAKESLRLGNYTDIKNTEFSEMDGNSNNWEVYEDK